MCRSCRLDVIKLISIFVIGIPAQISAVGFITFWSLLFILKCKSYVGWLVGYLTSLFQLWMLFIL